MSTYYDQADIPAELRRTFDVYDRIRALQIPLGSFDTEVVSLAHSPSTGRCDCAPPRLALPAPAGDA